MAAAGRHRDSDCLLFREIVLSHISKRVAKTSTEIGHEVLNDYGKFGDRRLFRTLAILTKLGVAKRTKPEAERELDEDASVSYVYVKLLDRIPKLAPQFACSECGMIGVQRRSHPLHTWYLNKIEGPPQYRRAS